MAVGLGVPTSYLIPCRTPTEINSYSIFLDISFSPKLFHFQELFTLASILTDMNRSFEESLRYQKALVLVAHQIYVF